MKTYLFKEGKKIAEFIDNEVYIEKNDSVMLDGMLYMVVDIIYKINITNERAELEEHILL